MGSVVARCSSFRRHARASRVIRPPESRNSTPQTAARTDCASSIRR
jgi:hypothetical protein